MPSASELDSERAGRGPGRGGMGRPGGGYGSGRPRSEEHTSELQSRLHLVCRLLLEKKKKPLPHLNALNHATSRLMHIHSAKSYRPGHSPSMTRDLMQTPATTRTPTPRHRCTPTDQR